jgi:hypothetical protein
VEWQTRAGGTAIGDEPLEVGSVEIEATLPGCARVELVTAWGDALPVAPDPPANVRLTPIAYLKWPDHVRLEHLRRVTSCQLAFHVFQSRVGDPQRYYVVAVRAGGDVIAREEIDRAQPIHRRYWLLVPLAAAVDVVTFPFQLFLAWRYGGPIN